MKRPWLHYACTAQLLAFLLSLTISANATLQHFTVLHTADEHSSLMPVPLVDYYPGTHDLATGGFARLATLVKNLRAKNRDKPLLLLSSGDFIGGTPFSWLILTQRSPELAIMYELGYHATTIGNHEFDYGSQGLADYLNRLYDQEKLLPVVVSNLQTPAAHSINQAGIKKHLLLKLNNGLQIGIFALFGKSAHRVSPDAKPFTFADQIETARSQVEQLKQLGAQIIIALTHSGIVEDRELAQSVAGIHLILGGHDHLRFTQPEKVNQTLIMHSGFYTQNLAELPLTWNTDTQQLELDTKNTASPILHKIDSQLTEDQQIAAMVNTCRRQLDTFIASFTSGRFADIRQTIGHSAFDLPRNQPFSETTVGNFVTDAMRIETEKLLEKQVDFAVQANGVIRGGLLTGHGKSNSGNISLYDLISISSMGTGPDGLPGYPLVSLYLTGNEIYRLLEIAAILPQLWGDIYFLQFSGLRYTYDKERTFWIRKIPWLNLPWPAYRSVLSAERLIRSGETPGADVYETLEKSDSRLYHLVTTHYLATYLPMVGSRLPRLKLTIKNRKGDVISLNDAIIRDNDREFKVWEATARYLASFEKNKNSLPEIPERYRTPEGRINPGNGGWLWLWPLMSAFVVMIMLLIYLHYRFRRKNKKAAITAARE